MTKTTKTKPAAATGTITDEARRKWDAWQAAAVEGTIRDEENPAFLFNASSTGLLLAIARGEIDPVVLAKLELVSRGLGTAGEWVGFAKSEAIWSGR